MTTVTKEEYDKLVVDVLFKGQFVGQYFNEEGKFEPALLSLDVQKIFHIVTLKDNREIYIYNEKKGYYEPNGEETLRVIIKKILGTKYREQHAKAVIDDLTASTQIERKDFHHPSHLIPVNNGLIDLLTPEPYELLKHDPKYARARGRIVPFSKDLGIGQYFSNLIMSRIHKQKPCNVIFTGEAGISKTYCAIGLARYLQPSFTVEQVAMTYAEFMKLMLKLKEGQIIVLDEPEYIAGHRDWYKDQNKALVATMRSGRFKVHPVFIPIINKSLLDKVVRQHLLQYQIWLEDRGEGTVYQLAPSHFTDDTYTKFLCRIKLEMLDVNKCEKMWCFTCESFKDNSCQLLRAQYEHKRQRIQDQRYKQDLDKSQAEEARKITFEQWLKLAHEHYDEFWYTTESGKRRISTEKICLLLGCSQTMAQRIRQTLNQMTREEVLEFIRKRLGII